MSTLRTYLCNSHFAVPLVLGFTSLFFSAPAAHADTITLTAGKRGVFSSTGASSFSATGNFLVGGDSSAVYHNFFGFDLSSVGALNITGAQLSLSGLTSTNCVSADFSETFNLYDVTAAAPITNADPAATFADLGSGVQYGSYNVSFPASGTLSYNLNSAALIDLNARQGGYFNIGGAISSLRGVTEKVFSSTSGSSYQATLVLTTATAPVPEPNTYAMMALGVGALGLMGWKRKRSVNLETELAAKAI